MTTTTATSSTTTATTTTATTTTVSAQQEQEQQQDKDAALPHDLLKAYMDTTAPLGRRVLHHLESDGYIVLPAVLTDEECQTEYNRLWDFVEATAPGVSRQDPTTWYPPTTNDDEAGGQASVVVDPWPHSGWNFLAENCQSYGAGWLFSELREKLATRVFQPLYGTRQLHSSKEGFTFFRPTAQIPAGYQHGFRQDCAWRVCNKVAHNSLGDHFDQRAVHTGLQCIQSSTALTSQNAESGDACFVCWPGSHAQHAQMTRHIWRGRSDWVPLTDAELGQLQRAGYTRRCVFVQRGDVILWRSDLVHCGAPPFRPTTNFRAVSYTCMVPAALTPRSVWEQKLRHYCGLLSGDHRPNVFMPHLSQPKKKTSSQQRGRRHKTVKGGEVIQPTMGRYFANGRPKLTWRQAELYGLVDYNDDDDDDDKHQDDNQRDNNGKTHAVQGADGRTYWDPPQEFLDKAMKQVQ